MYSTSPVKPQERKRRGSSDKLTVKGLKTQKPQNWKTLLCNEENKQQFVELMQTCWTEMMIEEQTVILVKYGDAFQISPEQEGQLTAPELKSRGNRFPSDSILQIC